MKTNLVRIVLVVVIVLVGIQFIPVNRSNPPVEEEVPASPEVKAVLKRACYDCHSNETVWPGYSRVAPVSWLLAWDVREGREELNFSTWNRYNQKKRGKIIKEIWEEVQEGEMPLGFIFRSIRTRGFRIVIVPCCEYGQKMFRRFQKTRTKNSQYDKITVCRRGNVCISCI